MIIMKEISVDSKDAQELMGELSDTLQRITGSSGKSSFDSQSMDNPRAVFLAAYQGEDTVGCGVLQEYTKNTGEIKRVYVRKKGMGIGTEIIHRLEEKARMLGYTRIILETRRVNQRAVQFYLHNGYLECDNYGKYKNRAEAVCFSKEIGEVSKRTSILTK